MIRLGFLELFLNTWYELGSAKSIDRLQYKDFIFIFNTLSLLSYILKTRDENLLPQKEEELRLESRL